MRTDRRSENDSLGAAALSRRGFLVAGGSVAGVGVGGTTGGASGEFGRPVEVAAAAPYLPAVRNVVEGDEGPPADVNPIGETDGTADVRISGRPTEGGDPAAAVAIQGWAALSHSSAEWRECRHPSDHRLHSRDDGPVETWSESDWASVSELEDPADAVGRADAAAAVFVRGVRSYQYASGHGGVGYYDVDAAELTDLTADSDDLTPVARIAYVHVDEDARSTDRLSAFLRRYRDRTGDVEDVTTRYVDPVVGN